MIGKYTFCEHLSSKWLMWIDPKEVSFYFLTTASLFVFVILYIVYRFGIFNVNEKDWLQDLNTDQKNAENKGYMHIEI